MILPFSTQLNGKPTYFVERIHAGLIAHSKIPTDAILEFAHPEFNVDALAEKHMKIHTIRDDKSDRWKQDVLIDFFINTRKPNMTRFAPKIHCKGTQTIEITFLNEEIPTFTGEVSKLAKTRYNEVDVCVDGNVMSIKDIKELSENDGFDTVEDFFNYFNKDFTGKIIHWSDKIY